MTQPNCQDCPLSNVTPKVTCDTPIRKVKWAIVGEAPGISEEVEGAYFVGPSGRKVNEFLRHKGVTRSQVHINNALRCKAPRNLSPQDWRKAIKCCEERLVQELRLSGATHVVVCGQRAFSALTSYWNHLNPWLGALVPSDKIEGLTVIPSLHPAFCLRGKAQYWPAVWTYFSRAHGLAHGTIQPFQWPTLHYYGTDERETLEALQHIKREVDQPVGMDIETAGKDPLTVPLTAVGLANFDCAVSLAWPLDQFYGTSFAKKAGNLVKQILKNPKLKKVAHNGSHDLLGLERQGLEVKGYAHDTILLHHIAANTQWHNLAFVSQLLYPIDPWKKLFGISRDDKGLAKFLNAKKEELTKYNAKDSAILPFIQRDLLEYIRDHVHNGLELYQETFDLAMIATEMRASGVQKNWQTLKGHKRKLTNNARKARREYIKVAGEIARDGWGPKGDRGYLQVKPSSPGDAKRLFFDLCGVTPRSYSPKTGDPSLPAAHLRQLRFDRDPIVSRAARALLRYRKYSKLYSTYVKKQIESPGELIHATPKVYGTKGGRFSYSNPNLQNIAPSVRDIITTKYTNGWVLEADYSQLELRIIAYLSKDIRMISWFEEGKDLHTETARLIFGIPESEEVPKKLRKLAKAINFGDNYGAEAETIWRMIIETMGGVQLNDVAKMLELRHIAHPHMVAWRHEQVQIAYTKDYTECPLSGRRQYFFGEVEPTKCYNYPIQGTGADIINRALPKVVKSLKRIPDSEVIFQVHDALICDTTDPVRVAKVLKRHMEAPVELGGVERIFPIDYKLGRNWGDSIECATIEDIKKVVGLGKGQS